MRAHERIRQDWDDLARVDPLWGVVTHRDRKNRGWPEEEFFATGERQVSESLSVAEAHNLPRNRARALDYGCGVGRLTRALAARFEHVCGLDLSGSLIRQATELNRQVPNCTFVALQDGDLSRLPGESADLVYCMLVLQHQSTQGAARQLIGEFVRLLSPGGVAIFQMPTYVPPIRRIQPRRRAYSALRTLGLPAEVLYRRLRLDPIRMLHLPSAEVLATVERAGGAVVTMVEDTQAGAFPSTTYYVSRPPPSSTAAGQAP